MSFPIHNGVEVLRLPPSNYEVDFDNPKSNKVLEHFLIFGIGGSLALVALCQRFYTKIFLSKGLGIDDGKNDVGKTYRMLTITGFMFIGWVRFSFLMIPQAPADKVPNRLALLQLKR